ncbi:O-linked N-acetylglucosamine transferase, SPINDLY family protein [Moorena bouillonii]|uniref:O-linked N-acetylglucosamine transferase, SPINDLY family protein n=1 Tax=Moorena bouillonii PNG TaxID=568701 RepID=A0A1U7N455_9CYAN|nr:O-linked N-acetylglucosamine transferase, SPINDLY family protein [Moorena bouillonii]OLT60737.1 O-linked N-acetylglucosamine transferase, SPINDLY family protein [Moorena bouillonii PNG]
MTNWQQQAEQYLIEGDYSKAASLYEQAIEAEPDCISYYWHLGLLFLLQGQETEAQTTWLVVMAEAESDQVKTWTEELLQVLQTEAERRQGLADYAVAWAIRQHMREICPTDLTNLLEIIALSIKLETFTGDDLTELGVIELLKTQPTVECNQQLQDLRKCPLNPPASNPSLGDFESRTPQNWGAGGQKQLNFVSPKLLKDVLEQILEAEPLHPASLAFTEACLAYLPNPEVWFWPLLSACMKIGHTLKQPTIAARFLESYRSLNLHNPHNIEILRHLASFYQNACNYDQGIETAKLCYSLSESLPDKISGINLVLRGIMNAGGYWQEVSAACQTLESLLVSLIKEQLLTLSDVETLRLLTPFFPLAHVHDQPSHFRPILNQIAELFQRNIRGYTKEKVEWYGSPLTPLNKGGIEEGAGSREQGTGNREQGGKTTKPLKVGYLSGCLRRHSVGWLARWLFEHHDRERFQLYGYFVDYKLVNDNLQEWYINQVDHPHKLGIHFLEAAEQIYQDELDILIDLDSITLDISCAVMALKLAPVQVTWLGWDASGLPAIDYMIADPYVLPDSAQEYYSEKIWRLPQTYIAVDGFEVGVPSLRREHLDIPNDATIYLSSQKGYKRNPDTTRLQMKIIKAVPNSYFLIKGKSDQDSIKRFFNQIAEEEGVECDRLRFLPEVPTEAVHRANLGIADVVLDTYPYNGATTTLETLWMGIPLVTRVGEQFVARNSYTMMMNAGITEGIAWTDDEYIEWGIRLGKDPALRQQISWKLRQSRQTAPLWNGKQFTREMEKAYLEMLGR